MKILMLTWEFPPLIAGGLAMACYGMAKALLEEGVEILLVIPTEKDVYFHLKKPEDADIMPPTFMDKETKVKFETVYRDKTIREQLAFFGVSERPETYLNGRELKRYMETFSRFRTEKISTPDRIMSDMQSSLMSNEGLFRKVREYTMRVARFVKTLDFDVIHAHDWLCYPAGIVASNLTKKPLVSHIHATEFDRAGGPGDDRIHKIEFAGLTLADRVIAVSNYTANIIVNRYRADTARIRVVHNAFHLQQRDPEKKRIFHDPVILFLGRITLQKGPDYFLELANRVLKQFPLARFIMVGTGDLAEKMIHKSAKFKLGTRFLFTGFMNRDEVENILSASDIMVLPSVSEPFGIAPLEAMSFGIATIISKQSGVSEVVKNAWKVDFWDVEKMSSIIIDLLNDPGKMYAMGEAAAEEVGRIQWAKAAKLINKCYEELV